MSAASTLLERMKRNPTGDWTMADVKTVCRQYDIMCTPPRGGGSHYKLSDPARPDILMIPHRRPVKSVYIRLLVRFIRAVITARGGSA